jgi:glycosyltransferase involved in cell wall biosynthesis
METYKFKGVGLLITHYNRSSSLERLLKTFSLMNCEFEEIVVSDDGSTQAHLDSVQQLSNRYGFKLIRSEVNKGLGNNINKGQDAITSPLTLYVQEDFVPTDLFPESFVHALDIFREDLSLDIVRFYAYYNYPYLKDLKYGYAEMLFKPWFFKYKKIYFYSDHPHLRRSDFLAKFGRYEEHIKGDRMEYRKCIKFLQKGGKGLFYRDYTALFKQINSDVEPSQMVRTNWTQTKNPLISVFRNVYRQLKYNYDILFLKL